MEEMISSIIDLHENDLSEQIFGASFCDDDDDCDDGCDSCSDPYWCPNEYDCYSGETLCSSVDYPDERY